jgi:hypothetical protein
LENISNKIKNNRVLIFLTIFGILIVITLIGSYETAKKENLKSYHFVVSKTDRAVNGFMTLYDKEKKEIKIYSYYLTDTIKPGDSIAKEKYSHYLNVYRKDFQDKYKLLISFKRKKDFENL